MSDVYKKMFRNHLITFFCLLVVVGVNLTLRHEIDGQKQIIESLQYRNDVQAVKMLEYDKTTETLLFQVESLEASVTAWRGESERLVKEYEKLSQTKAQYPTAVSTPVAQTTFTHSGSAAEVEALIRRVANERGYGEPDESSLVWLAQRESTLGQNPVAYQRGRTCVGLFQLDNNKGTYEQRIDNEWNVNRTITYIQERYATVSNAVAHHKAEGWF